MAKSKIKKVNGIKAVKGDVVTHNGKRWTVLDRDYDSWDGHSFYMISTGSKKSTSTKWVRSDKFSLV